MFDLTKDHYYKQLWAAYISGYITYLSLFCCNEQCINPYKEPAD